MRPKIKLTLDNGSILRIDTNKKLSINKTIRSYIHGIKLVITDKYSNIVQTVTAATVTYTGRSIVIIDSNNRQMIVGETDDGYNYVFKITKHYVR